MRHVFLLLAATFAVTASAQDVPKDYKKLLTDGKEWKCMQVWRKIGEDGFLTKAYKGFNETVIGDTVTENGRTWKKLCRVYDDKPDEKIYHLLYEEGTIIYDEKDHWNDEEQKLEYRLRPILDFGMDIGDRAWAFHSDDLEPVDEQYGIPVIKVDTISVKGNKYRRLTFEGYGEEGCDNVFWVEGIGASQNIYLLLFPVPTCTECVLYEYVVSVYDNEKCIFERNDFFGPSAGLNSVTNDTLEKSERLYDITGKQISSPRKGEVYIKNGKKILEKNE